MTLTPETLEGMYAFVPLPWDESYDLDEATLRSDLEYLCDTSIAGVYAADSTGEFVTLDFEEYRIVVDVVMEVANDAGMPVQINCAWTNERGALRRAKYAAERGVDAVRFAFPYWKDLTVDNALAFIERLEDATDDVPLVHYNNPRTAPVFGVEEYRQAMEVAPSLIGTKLVGDDPIDLARIIEECPNSATSWASRSSRR